MKMFSFWHTDTGLFNGQTFATTNNDAVALNTPADHIAIEGAHDHLSQRVDITTGQVIDYQPPAPSPDYEWNIDTKRWQLSAAAQSKIDNHNSALAQILELEAKGARAMRELALGATGVQQRLADIDTQITALRSNL